MANKISTVLDNIATKLAELVASGTLKAVQRTVINPLKAQNTPVVGLAISRLSRADQIWNADVLLMLLARTGDDTPDEAVIDLVGAVDAKIAALREAGTAAGALDLPVWDLWHHPNAGHLQRVGAIGGLRIRVEDPLVT